MYFQGCGKLRYISLLALSLLLPGLTYAAGITIGSGGAFNLGDGSITLNCNEFNIASSSQASLDQGTLNSATNIVNNGQLNGSQGTINFTGNWTQSGNFTAGTSQINLADGCNVTTTTISGSSTFSNFSATTTTGRSLNFEAGTTQQISNALTLTGSAGNLLVIRSTVAGQTASLNLDSAATQAIDYVDVADNQASSTPIAPGNPAAYNSTNSGNTSGWFVSLSNDIFNDDFE